MIYIYCTSKITYGGIWFGHVQYIAKGAKLIIQSNKNEAWTHGGAGFLFDSVSCHAPVKDGSVQCESVTVSVQVSKHEPTFIDLVNYQVQPSISWAWIK